MPTDEALVNRHLNVWLARLLVCFPLGCVLVAWRVIGKVLGRFKGLGSDNFLIVAILMY
jgi:hypothetical protein